MGDDDVVGPLLPQGMVGLLPLVAAQMRVDAHDRRGGNGGVIITIERAFQPLKALLPGRRPGLRQFRRRLGHLLERLVIHFLEHFPGHTPQVGRGRRERVEGGATSGQFALNGRVSAQLQVLRLLLRGAELSRGALRVPAPLAIAYDQARLGLEALHLTVDLLQLPVHLFPGLHLLLQFAAGRRQSLAGG